jgi:hypothetical protein
MCKFTCENTKLARTIGGWQEMIDVMLGVKAALTLTLCAKAAYENAKLMQAMAETLCQRVRCHSLDCKISPSLKHEA